MQSNKHFECTTYSNSESLEMAKGNTQVDFKLKISSSFLN